MNINDALFNITNPEGGRPMNSDERFESLIDLGLASVWPTNQPPTDQPPTEPAKRLLDFTLVNGHLRGEHTCPFELHATGCRDLNKLTKLGYWNFNVYAESREAAVPAALEELGGVAKVGDIWVQPCCLLKRMKAIGRA